VCVRVHVYLWGHIILFTPRVYVTLDDKNGSLRTGGSVLFFKQTNDARILWVYRGRYGEDGRRVFHQDRIYMLLYTVSPPCRWETTAVSRGVHLSIYIYIYNNLYIILYEGYMQGFRDILFLTYINKHPLVYIYRYTRVCVF